MADTELNLDPMVEALEVEALERQAKMRHASALPRAQLNQSFYETLHKLYAPLNGDQWPEDRLKRPEKLHYTANIVRAFVDTEARLMSILPRITNKPDARDPETLKRAEVCEELFLRWLEMSDWENWMLDKNRVKGLYGIAYLKPYWNDEEKRPDVVLIEQPQNLMMGWGSSDFTVADWAIYSYKISYLQARTQWPDVDVAYKKGSDPLVSAQRADHSDPLAQRGVLGNALSAVTRIGDRSRRANEGEYEKMQLTVWDYWYRKPGGPICNVTMLQGKIVDGPHEHPEYPTIPYIPIEHDHEPGSPDGRGTAELLVDLQLGLNRALSHLAQYVADEIDTAYQLTGENADSVPEGIVPKGGEIVAAGSGNEIKPITRGVNQFPLEALIGAIWETAHRITGLSEVLFGNTPGSQTAGRALAVQIEAAINRLDAKRRRDYAGLRKLLLFWGFMVAKKNPKVAVSKRPEAEEGASPLEAPEETVTNEISVADVIRGLDRWRVVAPEITPRDVMEHTMDIINKVNAKTLPLEMAMDELGVENPRQAMEMIEKERSNPRLFPADAQAFAVVMSTLQQLEATQAAMASAGQAQAAANDGTGAGAAAEDAAQQAAPTGTEDMNQPATQVGSPPPPGAPGPLGGQLQSLVRATPGGESQSMSQIQIKRNV
jgi:hypothetical protein